MPTLSTMTTAAHNASAARLRQDDHRRERDAQAAGSGGADGVPRRPVPDEIGDVRAAGPLLRDALGRWIAKSASASMRALSVQSPSSCDGCHDRGQRLNQTRRRRRSQRLTMTKARPPQNRPDAPSSQGKQTRHC